MIGRQVAQAVETNLSLSDRETCAACRASKSPYVQPSKDLRIYRLLPGPRRPDVLTGQTSQAQLLKSGALVKRSAEIAYTP